MLNKLGFFAVLGTVALIACGSDDDSGGGSTSCVQNPWSCAAGTTCWATDTQGAFSCLTSGSKQKGDVCSNAVGAADCADGLFCFANALTPSEPATCHPFCDPSHPCPASEACATLQNFGARICVGTGAGGASGAGGGAGSAGAAGAAGSGATAGSGGSTAGSGGSDSGLDGG